MCKERCPKAIGGLAQDCFENVIHHTQTSHLGLDRSNKGLVDVAMTRYLDSRITEIFHFASMPLKRGSDNWDCHGHIVTLQHLNQRNETMSQILEAIVNVASESDSELLHRITSSAVSRSRERHSPCAVDSPN